MVTWISIVLSSGACIVQEQLTLLSYKPSLSLSWKYIQFWVVDAFNMAPQSFTTARNIETTTNFLQSLYLEKTKTYPKSNNKKTKTNDLSVES